MTTLSRLPPPLREADRYFGKHRARESRSVKMNRNVGHGNRKRNKNKPWNIYNEVVISSPSGDESAWETLSGSEEILATDDVQREMRLVSKNHQFMDQRWVSHQGKFKRSHVRSQKLNFHSRMMGNRGKTTKRTTVRSEDWYYSGYIKQHERRHKETGARLSYDSPEYESGVRPSKPVQSEHWRDRDTQEDSSVCWISNENGQSNYWHKPELWSYEKENDVHRESLRKRKNISKCPMSSMILLQKLENTFNRGHKTRRSKFELKKYELNRGKTTNRRPRTKVLRWLCYPTPEGDDSESESQASPGRKVVRGMTCSSVASPGHRLDNRLKINPITSRSLPNLAAGYIDELESGSQYASRNRKGAKKKLLHQRDQRVFTYPKRRPMHDTRSKMSKAVAVPGKNKMWKRNRKGTSTNEKRSSKKNPHAKVIQNPNPKTAHAVSNSMSIALGLVEENVVDEHSKQEHSKNLPRDVYNEHSKETMEHSKNITNDHTLNNQVGQEEKELQKQSKNCEPRKKYSDREKHKRLGKRSKRHADGLRTFLSKSQSPRTRILNQVNKISPSSKVLEPVAEQKADNFWFPASPIRITNFSFLADSKHDSSWASRSQLPPIPGSLEDRENIGMRPPSELGSWERPQWWEKSPSGSAILRIQRHSSHDKDFSNEDTSCEESTEEENPEYKTSCNKQHLVQVLWEEEESNFVLESSPNDTELELHWQQSAKLELKVRNKSPQNKQRKKPNAFSELIGVESPRKRNQRRRSSSPKKSKRGSGRSSVPTKEP